MLTVGDLDAAPDEAGGSAWARTAPWSAAAPHRRPVTSSAVSAACRGRCDDSATQSSNLISRLRILPVGTLGQLAEADHPGVLVRRQPLLDVGYAARPPRASAPSLSFTSAAISSPCRASGTPNDRRLGDGRVGVEHLLDLPRIHVEAVADDHVLQPVDDEVEAVRRRAGRDRRCGTSRRASPPRRLGVAPITLHHVLAADHDLADRSPATSSIVGVAQAELDPADRGAHRPRLGRQRPGG